MTIQDIGLMQAIGAKMDYLAQRQNVLAQNVSNSDTPGYQPKDLEPLDFSSLIKEKSAVSSVSLASTNEGHIGKSAGQLDLKSKESKHTYEVTPAGNAVDIEEQLMNATKNSMDYTLMLNVYQKQVGMFRIALQGQ